MRDPSDYGSWSPPPEGRGPSGPRASFGLRLGAALIDGIILNVVGFVVQSLLGQYLGYVLTLAVNFGYFGYFEGGPAGQTIGKLALGIRTVRQDTGGPLGWGTALLRNLCRIISALPCLLGYFWMLWDPEKMTWHDKLSQTVVVPVAAMPPPPNSFGQPPAS
ncbi:MAG: RDD family protein [Acidimicrobiia bacterium]|nr:RDD family protein [Acidimicrobiia bacterium]MBV9042665.1 RDD family protein [Acidimicrobiia bacterium]